MTLAVQGNPGAFDPVGALKSFIWGDNGQQLTPEQAQAQQSVADALMTQRPAAHTLGEGLQAVGDALVARHALSQSNAAIASGTEKASTDLQSVLADPSKAASFIANDPYATDGQKAVAQALLSQQMMLTNPDMIAQRANLAADTRFKTAQANEMQTGGPAVGTPFQDANGNWMMPTTYGGARVVAPNGPMDGSVPPAPSGAAPDTGGGLPNAPTNPAVSTQPLPGPAPLAAPVGTAAPAAAPAQTRFLTPAQQEQAKAAATAQGTFQGDLVQNQQRSASALEEQAIVNDSLLGATDPKTGKAMPGLIDQAIELAKNPLATGLPGQMTAGISSTPAADLGALLSQIQSNASTKAIQDFRDSAPAGATGMRITQAEALLFGKTLSNIAANQSPSQLIQQLTTLKSQLQSISGSMKDSYARLYGSLPAIKTHNLGAYPDGYAAPFQDDASAPVTAVNPATGRRIVVKGGAWVDAQTGQPVQ